MTARSLGPGLVVLVAWLLSASLRRYSTSGFENPLTLLLLSLFAVGLLAWRREAEPPWLSLGLLAGLGATNRLDTLLLFAPALLWLCAVERARLRPLRLVLGFAPLALWHGALYALHLVREFYRQLRIVTSGPLFTRERLRTILAFQLGRRPAPGAEPAIR